MWVEQSSDLKWEKGLSSQRAESNVMHRHCCHSPVPLFPQWKCAAVMMWAPLLGLQVSCAQVLQCFYFFILSLSHSVFSPSLSCTHARLASVGVWGMTHLLHTSSLLDHIWAARKSIFLHSCSGEEQAMQGQHDELFSSFSFLLYYFSENGPLIWAPRCLHHHRDKYWFQFYMSTSGFSVQAKFSGMDAYA